jgi:adenosylhomocysteine nucleosidase
VADGAGPRLAAKATLSALAHEESDVIVSVGFCGGLSPGLEGGDIFVASGLRNGSEQRPVRVTNGPPARTGVLLSVDRIVDTVEEKRELAAEGCDAVEMEAAAVEAIARERGIPFYCVRAVTDTAGEGFVCDLNGARTAEGRISIGRVVWSAVRHPIAGLPELLRLRRNAKFAASRLAAYLKDCEFEHE